jgi:hypothetical protein
MNRRAYLPLLRQAKILRQFNLEKILASKPEPDFAKIQGLAVEDRSGLRRKGTRAAVACLYHNYGVDNTDPVDAFNSDPPSNDLTGDSQVPVRRP